VVGLLQEFAVLAEQAEVDAPGVDADALDLALRLPGGHADPGLDVRQQAVEVPPQRALLFHGTVGETVHLFEAQPSVPDPAQHDPAAFGAEVHRDITVGVLCHRLLLPATSFLPSASVRKPHARQRLKGSREGSSTIKPVRSRAHTIILFGVDPRGGLTCQSFCNVLPQGYTEPN